MGCFLDLAGVCQLKRTELSKSSTLTRAAERLLKLFFISRVGPMTIGNPGSKMKSGKKCMTFGSEEGRIAYQLVCPCETQVFLFLDQIKREKGVW